MEGHEMPDETIFTAVQVSDLHFGNTLAGSASPIDPLLRLSHHFEGWLDHHWLGLREVHRFLSDLRKRDPSALLVISGDLTANGAVRQFDLAESFLRGDATNVFGFGLGVQGWVDKAIPGNHDHWPGANTVFGPPTQGYATCFPNQFPLIRPPIPLSGSRSVRFIMVNSDEDVGWLSRDRLKGRGLFVSQLQVL